MFAKKEYVRNDVVVIRGDLGKISAKTQYYQLFNMKFVMESSIYPDQGEKWRRLSRKPYEKADI